jgi:signal transduction histidine kinase
MEPAPASNSNISQPQLTRLAIVFATAAAYAIVLWPAYAATGVIAASLSVVPISVAGWLFGRWGGCLAGLVSIPAHVALFTLLGATGWLVVLDQWPGSVMGIVVGLMIGWLGEVVRRVQSQARDLARQREALRAEIAERERVEQALLQAKAEAEAASRAKSTFLANMSHELRTPLTTIIGYCELIQHLSDQPGYTNLHADLDRIGSAGQHLLTLISDILDLSKIEAGKTSLEQEWFGLAGLAYEVAAAMQPQVARQGNSLEVQCADDIGSIYADRTKVRQILLNLLSNAAKFTTQGKITLTIARESATEPESEWLWFAVADTGKGIAPEYLPRLFEPFTQADATRTRQNDGTGLGLTLSQRFCQLMGGNITVVSSPGNGSTFTVRLPLQIADRVAPQVVPDRAPLRDVEAGLS